jgi:hypothetical protein
MQNLLLEGVTIRRFLPVVAIALALPSGSRAQPTQIDLRTQTKSVDFSNAPSTRPFKTGTTLPATCALGEAFFKANAPAGQNWFGCTSTNNWTLQSGSGGGTALNGYTTVAFSSTPTFTTANNSATTFLLLLSGNVTSSSLSGPYAGQLLNFRICQDGAGGHSFTWPPNLSGAGTVNQTANACTNQTFVFDGSSAQAVSTATITGFSGSAITMPGSTSGTTTLQPSAAAGGTLTLPARTASVATTTGATAANDCAKFDASGNLVDSGAACGGGGSGGGGQHQWFPAATCGNGSAAVAAWDMRSDAPNTVSCNYFGTGAVGNFGTMQFSNSADGYAWLALHLPASFTTVNVTLRAWRGNSASGETRYILEGRCMADGDTGSTTFPNSGAVIAGAAAALSLETYAFNGFSTTGCNGGDILYLQLHRDHLCTGCSSSMGDISYFKGAQVDIQ